MKKFQVSSATIHRDVAELVSRDIFQKVHGGVAFVTNHSGDASKLYSSATFQERSNRNCRQKQKIADQAFSRIAESDILFLDSSTTVSYLANLLIKSNFTNLTIITNSVTIIQNFHKFPAHYVLLALGGSYDLQLNAFLGHAAIHELEELSISKAFISAFGVNDGNVTTNHENHSTLLNKVLEKAEQKYLLIDRSKLNRNGLFKLSSDRIFDEIISE